MQIKITPEMVSQFCGMIGCENPIHFKSDTIKYGHPIAPGILVTALISHNSPAYSVLAKLNAKYKDAVYVGDTVDIKKTVIKEKLNVCTNQFDILVNGKVKQIIEMTFIKAT